MLPLVATTNTSSAGLTHGNLSAKTTAKHHLQNGLLLQYSYRDGEQETRSQAVARIADRTSLVVLVLVLVLVRKYLLPRQTQISVQCAVFIDRTQSLLIGFV